MTMKYTLLFNHIVEMESRGIPPPSNLTEPYIEEKRMGNPALEKGPILTFIVAPPLLLDQPCSCNEDRLEKASRGNVQSC